MLGTISQACGLNYLPTLHQLIFGNDIDDMTGAFVCAISYHVYHSLKFGKKTEILTAIVYMYTILLIKNYCQKVCVEAMCRSYV